MFWRRAYLDTLILRPVIMSVCIVILGQNIGQAQGLKCMKCINIDLDKSPAGLFINPFLNFIPGIRNTKCLEPSFISGIDTVTCPPNPESGYHVYRCGAYTGTINIALENGLTNSSLRVINRQCVLIYQGLNYGCHPQAYVEEDANDFQKIFESLDNLGVVEFQGHVCLSDDAEAAPQTTCSSRRATQSLMLVSVICFLCVTFKKL
ncbi:uncharacterized protein LOC117325735 [Pecten maximus]|uniref:uncharacterized protein LOC117325735 n=1 Tax=Pecten maximus TaxID=6579 RepID=UPI00145804CD|nr:uncharacterized protein LOC117325735 [Pecten maximus]